MATRIPLDGDGIPKGFLTGFAPPTAYPGMHPHRMLNIHSPIREQQEVAGMVFTDALQRGLSTSPIDRKTIACDVAEMYGSRHRANIVWCKNPVELLSAAARLEEWTNRYTPPFLKNTRNGPHSGLMREVVGRYLMSPLADGVRRARHYFHFHTERGRHDLPDDTARQISRAINRNPLFASFGEAMQSVMSAGSVSLPQEYNGWAITGGQLDVGFTAAVAFLAHYGHDVQGACLRDALPYLRISRGCGAFLPGPQGHCFVSNRPSAIRHNGTAIHCETAPAIEYEGGLTLWAWNGVVVPSQVVLAPATVTLSQIDGERNLEVRRVMIERWGWERYLDESKADRLDQRHNERDCQEEVLYSSRSGRRFVVTDPSTGRKYALGVPTNISTCEEAQAWISHGLDRFAVHRS